MAVPWYCEECKTDVPDPMNRYVISEDALRADGKRRAYRIRIVNLCAKHMREREEVMRPTQIKGQETFFGIPLD